MCGDCCDFDAICELPNEQASWCPDDCEESLPTETYTTTLNTSDDTVADTIPYPGGSLDDGGCICNGDRKRCRVRLFPLLLVLCRRRRR